VTHVVVTLSAGAVAGLAEALAHDRITLEERPLLRFGPPADWEPLDRALAALDRYRAVVLTSPRAAETVADRWRGRPLSLEPGGAMWWATGPAAAAPLGDRFGPVRIPPEAPDPGLGAGERLADALLAAGTGSPVLHLCGEVHRDELGRRLSEAGITVDEVICYRALLASLPEAREAAARADILVVGSPRVAELVTAACRADRRPRLLALGPTTAAASRRSGWPPDAVAERPDAPEVARQMRALVRGA
jgi:uroporphyrinogen-III synthase